MQLVRHPINFQVLRDCLGDFNDCHYYFPDLDYARFGTSLISVTGSHYRAVPGYYKLPFCEGHYTIYPAVDDNDREVLMISQSTNGQGVAYIHKLVAIAAPTVVLSYGFMDHVGYFGVARGI